jgi:hypothetical protein
MVQQLSAQETAGDPSRWFGGARPMVIAALATVCAALLAGAALLWVHYGTAVFFEMIASGIAACI